MPPPNHQMSPAAKKRTFMCTVGQYGLRGCRTSDTPIASNARPASCGRAALAEGGNLAPWTREFTPPRSNTCPSSRMQLVPPPPSARCQVAHEALAVQHFQGGDDALLQAGEVIVDRPGVHHGLFFSAR